MSFLPSSSFLVLTPLMPPLLKLLAFLNYFYTHTHNQIYPYNLVSPFLLFVCDFLSDRFVWDSQRGSSCLGEADSPSLRSCLLLLCLGQDPVRFPLSALAWVWILLLFRSWFMSSFLREAVTQKAARHPGSLCRLFSDLPWAIAGAVPPMDLSRAVGLSPVRWSLCQVQLWFSGTISTRCRKKANFDEGLDSS